MGSTDLELVNILNNNAICLFCTRKDNHDLRVSPLSSYLYHSTPIFSYFLKKKKKRRLPIWMKWKGVQVSIEQSSSGTEFSKDRFTSKSVRRILLLKLPERHNYNIILWWEPWGQFHSETRLKYKIRCKTHLFKKDFIILLAQRRFFF